MTVWAGLVAVVGEVAVHVVHLRAPAPGLDRAAAGNPDRRMRLLDRPRPDVDVALLVVAAVEGEGVLLGPGLHDEVVRLVVALAQLARVLAVGVAVVSIGVPTGKPAISRPPEMQSIIANSSATRVGGL